MKEALIRPLESLDELNACVALQKKIWGEAFDDIASPALMKVGARIGGVTAGAFEADRETLVGIVFGLSGFRGDARIHWSHMLAVEPSHRGRGLGTALKVYQRDAVLRKGISTMFWTFDPLEARNAHFNINRLKADVDDYVADMYGSGETSPLHRGIGTDRLVVRWDLRSDAVEEALEPDLRQISWNGRAARVVLPLAGQPANSRPIDVPADRPELSDADCGLVEVPPDVQRLKAADPSAAGEWRRYTRNAVTTYLSRGCRVASFERDVRTGRCFYAFDRS